MEEGDGASEGTFDTQDLDTDEYLVDITDGMDVDETMADGGQQQSTLDSKPPWHMG